MRYTVTWSPVTERRLASIWNASSQQAAVTKAANRIDELLTRDPRRFAKQVDDEFWLLKVPPLVVLFTVSEDDMKVTVTHVKELDPDTP